MGLSAFIIFILISSRSAETYKFDWPWIPRGWLVCLFDYPTPASRVVPLHYNLVGYFTTAGLALTLVCQAVLNCSFIFGPRSSGTSCSVLTTLLCNLQTSHLLYTFVPRMSSCTLQDDNDDSNMARSEMPDTSSKVGSSSRAKSPYNKNGPAGRVNATAYESFMVKSSAVAASSGLQNKSPGLRCTMAVASSLPKVSL